MNTQKPADKISQHFPLNVRMRLVRAAQTPDPVQRVREVDAAGEWARTHYPELFRWPALSA